MAYPSDLPTDTASAGTSTLSSPDHSNRHNVIGSAVVGITTTLGTTSGTGVLKNFAAGDFPVRINSSNVLQQAIQGTINNAIVGTPRITGGTASSFIVGTSTVQGGTVANALVGTSTIQGGTANNQVIGSPALTGGTLTAYKSTMHTIGSAVITGTAGSTHNLDLSTASRFLVNFPNSAGSIGLTVSNVTANQPFIVELLQGTAGNGTVGSWFSTIRWAGSTSPTLTSDASRKDTFGFIATSTNTFDGYIVGQNV
jgi:hypothetical protein